MQLVGVTSSLSLPIPRPSAVTIDLGANYAPSNTSSKRECWTSAHDGTDPHCAPRPTTPRSEHDLRATSWGPRLVVDMRGSSTCHMRALHWLSPLRLYRKGRFMMRDNYSQICPPSYSHDAVLERASMHTTTHPHTYGLKHKTQSRHRTPGRWSYSQILSLDVFSGRSHRPITLGTKGSKGSACGSKVLSSQGGAHGKHTQAHMNARVCLNVR